MPKSALARASESNVVLDDLPEGMKVPIDVLDILIQSYMRASSPNLFYDPRNDLKDRKARAKHVLQLIAQIPFCERWLQYFRDCPKYNTDPAAVFTSQLFDIADETSAETESEFGNRVAMQLSEIYGQHILESGIDLEDIDGEKPFDVENAEVVAQFLWNIRRTLEEQSTKCYKAPRDISDGWLEFIDKFAKRHPAQGKNLLKDLTAAVGYAGEICVEEDGLTAGMLGGFTIFDAANTVYCNITEVLARYFPEIIVGKLKDAPTFDRKVMDGIKFVEAEIRGRMWGSGVGELLSTGEDDEDY